MCFYLHIPKLRHCIQSTTLYPKYDIVSKVRHCIQSTTLYPKYDIVSKGFNVYQSLGHILD